MYYNNKDISMAKGKGKNSVKVGKWDDLRLLSYSRTRSLRPQEPKRTKDTKRWIREGSQEISDCIFKGGGRFILKELTFL